MRTIYKRIHISIYIQLSEQRVILKRRTTFFCFWFVVFGCHFIFLVHIIRWFIQMGYLHVAWFIDICNICRWAQTYYRLELCVHLFYIFLTMLWWPPFFRETGLLHKHPQANQWRQIMVSKHITYINRYPYPYS